MGLLLLHPAHGGDAAPHSSRLPSPHKSASDALAGDVLKDFRFHRGMKQRACVISFDPEML